MLPDYAASGSEGPTRFAGCRLREPAMIHFGMEQRTSISITSRAVQFQGCTSHHLANPGRHNPHGGIMDKIIEFRAALKDQTKSKDDRRFALRFLIHCVEDLHMPMRVGDNNDKGETGPKSGSTIVALTCTHCGTR